MLVNVIRPIPAQAVDFVKAHEGCRLTAYLDSAGVPTVGFGHTGPEVRLGATITQDQADDYLRQNLATAAQRLEAAVGEACVTELTANQYAAMLSFTFNVGIDPKWQICKCLKAGNFDVIPSEMTRFVNAGGKKLAGLVNRRADEVKLWSTDEPGSIPDSPPSSVTRTVDTPPTQAAVKPLHKQGEFWAMTGAAGTLLLDQAQQGINGVKAAIQPFVADSTVLQSLNGHIALVGAGLAVAGVFCLWLKNREAKSQ